MSKGNIILRGITGMPSSGVIVGKVRIINGDKTKLAHIQPGDVVVIKDVDPAIFDAHEQQLRKASCIIKDNGGLSAHEIMRSLVWQIPSMFATETNLDMKEATKTLKDGMTVRVETFVGTFEQFNPKLQKNVSKKYGAIYEEVEGTQAPSAPPDKAGVKPDMVYKAETPPPMSVADKLAAIKAKYKTVGK
jgi:phosphohistidine swiveling domain-containing protein